MNQCKLVRKKLSENILIPVIIFITQSEQFCHDLGEWGTKQVPGKVEQISYEVRKFCRDLPWPLDFFCEAVTVAVKTLVDGLVTVAAWIVKTVCDVVTKIVGSFVTLLLRVFTWTIQFAVCLVEDPASALASFYDLWSTVLDAIDGMVGAVISILKNLEGFLGDLERIIDSVAGELGWIGLILAPFKAIVSLGKRVVGIARDAVDGARDAALGTLAGNPCRLSRGLASIAAAGGRAGVEAAFVIAGYAIGGGAIAGAGIRGAGLVAGGVRDLVRLKVAREVMEEKLRAAFSDDAARLDRALDSVRVGTSGAGVDFMADARRIYLSSRSRTVDLRALHQRGILNLYAYAGYAGNCYRLFNEADVEVVYAGTQLRVAFVDIQTFLSDGPDAVPEFHVFPITRDNFRAVLNIAQDKLRYLAVRLSAPAILEQNAIRLSWVPWDVGPTEATADEPQREIWKEVFDRFGVKTDALGTIPSLAHFHYGLIKGSEHFGLTSWFRPSEGKPWPSGVSFRLPSPHALFNYVLVHEMGHYLGLDHELEDRAKRGPDELMFSPSTGGPTVQMLYEYLLLGGEPRFTFQDIDDAWTWLTTDAKEALFP